MIRELPLQFVRYAVVGVAGTLMDVALLWLLLRIGAWSPIAVTLAYATATLVQFFLYRHWSFRALDRPALTQAPTYLMVTIVNYLLALGFVEIGSNAFHLAPLTAKALSIPPSAIVGFLGNRQLTFRPRTPVKPKD